MIDPGLLNELQRIAGKEHIRSGLADLEVYAYDASLARALPGAVVFPADSGQTAAVVRAASEAGVPYVPRGFGTNLSGGSVAPAGGLVICLSRLNRILSIETERRCARVQPGVTNLELQNALAPFGFFYAPDPASQKVSTLGGNVGENSGGPRCVKYGVTKNHVLGLEVVLPDGELLRVGGAALDPPGYDLCGVLIGSEGTLGIVTEVTVRILPLPESVVTLLAVYDDISDAARSVSGIIAAGIVPSSLEMMDAPVMRAVEESIPCGYPLDAQAVLIIEVDGPARGLRSQADRIRQICAANRCRQVREAKDAAERNLLWAGRRGAFGAIARIAPSYLVTDCTVPRTMLPEALAQVAAVARQHGLSHGNVFHAGDGNLHPLLFFDSRDPDQLRRVHEAGWEIMKACAALGGTITGEHGVGLEKREAMRLVFSEDDLDLQRAIRHAFDPKQLLNPGKIIPEPVRASPKEKAPAREVAGLPALIPASSEEACEMVRGALLQHVALVPEGTGRWRTFGNVPARRWVSLRSSGLAELLDYDPANQVVTVGAGIRLCRLQEFLAAERQWLPVRPLHGSESSAGSLVALDAWGPERLRYGAPHDLLLGLRFVSAQGNLILAGGKVVKNVAGYDVVRLLAGSTGTLGLLTELTFRVSPLPERCRAVSAWGTLEEISAARSALLRSNIDPAFVAAVPTGSDRKEAEILREVAVWHTIVGLEGFGEAVEAQERLCTELLSENRLRMAVVQDYGVWDLPAPFAEQAGMMGQSPFLLRVDMPIDRTSDFFLALPDTFKPDGVLADLGTGRVRAGLSALPEASWEFLCSLADRLGGRALLERAPLEFRERWDVFGRPRPEWRLVHRIKDALDPENVFSPGRLPGRK